MAPRNRDRSTATTAAIGRNQKVSGPDEAVSFHLSIQELKAETVFVNTRYVLYRNVRSTQQKEQELLGK